jgi:hypothetical protein
VRVRLFRRTGLQGAQGGGIPRHPRELQSRHDHDGPRDGRCRLHRAHQLAHAGTHH